MYLKRWNKYKMTRRFMIWVFPVIIFLFMGMIIPRIVHSTSGYPWVMTHSYLNRLHWFLESSKEMHGSLPEEEAVNLVITKLWNEKNKPSASGGVKISETSNDELVMILACIDYRELKLWGKPPVYIVSKNLPGGFGLYMEGEDGVTHSKGNDPDDLNSWDKDSRSFYTKRKQREDMLDSVLISLIPTLIVVIVCRLKWRKKYPDVEGSFN